jgi:hypothetical protein
MKIKLITANPASSTCGFIYNNVAHGREYKTAIEALQCPQYLHQMGHHLFLA